jgi:release factor glutamine methyltransferase
VEIASLLAELPARLAAISTTSQLDAQVLLAHVLERPRAWVLAHPEATLSPARMAALESALARLQAGEPLPYVLGAWEFYGLSFQVTPAVLIPRPETELLVETALAWLRRQPERRQAYDVGAGSGCIAIALAVHVSDLQVTASDLSAAALAVARRNARQHQVTERVRLLQADLLSAARFHSIDLLCANLPYIPRATLHRLPIYGREPTLALDGGPAGLDLIERLLRQAPGCLAPGGLALLEIEAGQGPAAAALARIACPAAEVTVQPDLAGHDRLLVIQA